MLTSCYMIEDYLLLLFHTALCSLEHSERQQESITLALQTSANHVTP